ncbi:hypothetical protein [Rhodococcus sp. 11-3]|uniref:hypothetical protein n=1 Tax=Rhodococcus sp. 11-3 TaxID=2854796 RepID=UPI00203D0427|nr:hypothetical protein [Rhodococcus sp. 11-3]USC18460.1 hypothetical protein KZJ41_28260 [Rhodococcus sp. 11-3]
MAEPWSVSVVDGGRVRFTNETGAKAVMVTMQGTGVDFDHTVPAPVDPGKGFEVKFPSSGSGVRINWSTTDMQHRTWVYSR